MRIRSLVALAVAGILAVAAIIVAVGVNRYNAPQGPSQAYARNFEQVAYHDLGGRAGFKMAMQTQAGRWYLYVAGLWNSGWMVLDVTDPHHPQLLSVTPSPPSSQAVQVQVSHGKMLTGLEKPSTELLEGAPWETFAWILWRQVSGRPLLTPWAPLSEGVWIWDVTAPARPRLEGRWASGTTGTHRNFYNGGRYAFLAATRPGYRGHILVILDLKDPARPQEISTWSLPEQRISSGITPKREGYYFHGPAHVEGDRAYLPYGVGGAIILDISDIRRPREVGRLLEPKGLGSVQGVHTFLPIPSRKLAVINTEAHAEHCRADPGRTYAAMVDISDESHPRLVSLFPEAAPPHGAPYRSFCELAGRAGPHNQHHANGEPHLFQSDRLVYMASFSSGLRLYDTSDARNVREIGYFLPPNPARRLGPLPTRLVAQTEDVIVDARGYAYITDKNQGLYILRATAPEALAALHRAGAVETTRSPAP